MSPRIIQMPMSGGDRKHYVREFKAAEQEHRSLIARVDAAYHTAHQLLCKEWNTRQFLGGPVEPSPTLNQAIHGGCVYLEVRCKRCGHESLVDLRLVVWPRSKTIHTLAKVLHCQECRNERKTPTADLVALRMPGQSDPAAPAVSKQKRS